MGALLLACAPRPAHRDMSGEEEQKQPGDLRPAPEGFRQLQPEPRRGGGVLNPAGSLQAVLRRDRLLVAGALVAIAALAWGYTVYRASYIGGEDGSMDGMAMTMPLLESWGAEDFLSNFAMWAVMMVAMMVPSAAPMVLMYASMNRQRRAAGRPLAPTGIFVLGYLVVWSAFALLATTGQWGLHAATLISPSLALTSSVLGGSLLLAAGIYQWTPLKYTCLTQCRTPLGFILGHWRDGTAGAFTMGLRHGLFCLGCWVLMGLLFVAGVMNLLWVAAIAAFILVEKVAPAGRWVSRVSGVALMVWGVVVLANRVI